VVTPAPPAALGREDAVLVREVAEPEAVSRARAVLTRFAVHGGAPEIVRSALALAVTEACKNVVMHAYVDRDSPGDLEVRACIAEAVLVVEVTDDGKGMVPRVDGPGRGLGLPLIAQMADVFEILRRPQRPGVVLRMHFNLAGPPETES
jgi:serine/threonine-protein kinase RsbW